MSSSQSPTSALHPFAAAPDPTRYFPALAVEEARQRVTRSVTRGEGPSLVIGAPGLGKTMLLEVIAHQFRNRLHAILLPAGQLCTRRALYQMILFQLGQSYKGMDESELRLSLLSYLQPQQSAPQQILLLVDEADALPQRLLEELRSLTNLSAGGQLLVKLVLAGNSALEEHFADPKLELFSQRISARCYLAAFGREETFQYIRAQVAAANCDPDSLFTEEALEAIFAATDGSPRLINQLGDQLMWMIAETGIPQLDGNLVQQAWSELQQLPAPWNTQAKESLGVEVEFGELSSETGEFTEVVFEDDSYEAEYDDDRPASIPIHSSRANPSESQESAETEAIDVTEQLLSQLHELNSANEEQAPEALEPQPVRNPFEESFESEELVLDQYSRFESMLLAEAPRVFNRSDTAFAQQLKQLEDFHSLTCTETFEESVPDIIEASTHQNSSKLPAEDFGDVLVIEDTEHAQTSVVEGHRFRQLFSSLETADNEPRFA